MKSFAAETKITGIMAKVPTSATWLNPFSNQFISSARAASVK